MSKNVAIVLKRQGRTKGAKGQSRKQRIDYIMQRAMSARRHQHWELESKPLVTKDYSGPEHYDVTFRFRFKGKKILQFDSACDQLVKIVLAAGRSCGFKSGTFQKNYSIENQERANLLAKVASQVLRVIPSRWGSPPDDFSIRMESWQQLHYAVETLSPVHLIGPTGSGKTSLVSKLAERRRQPLEVINIGDLGLDPTALLKGEKELDDGKTVFEQSCFAEALQTQGTLIFLDEWTRAHTAVKNLFIPLLDHKRELVLNGKTRIKLANGVSFIAASNIGGEYAGTFRQDAAQEDRFQIVLQLNYLTPEEELRILRSSYPLINDTLLHQLCEFAAAYRTDFLSGKLTVPLTTRIMKALCRQLSCRLFSLDSAFEHIILNRLPVTPDSVDQRARVLLLKQFHFA